MSPRKRRLAEKFRSLYLWHRYAGLVAAVLVIWLAVTGIFLNHSDDMNLAGTFVHQEWLLSLYNIEASEKLAGLHVDGHWLTQSNNRVYLDTTFINDGKLVAAVAREFGFVVAFTDRVALYTADTRLIEEIPFTISAAPITAMQTTSRGLVISTAENQFLADAQMTRFVPLATPVPIPEMQFEPLPAELTARIAADVLHHSLTWERVLLDLHAGRIFGAARIVLADLAGVLLLLLAVSGVMVWIQHRGR